MVKIRRSGWIRDILAIHNDRIGWLAKKEGRITIRIFAHFTRMGRIVSPNAINSVNREQVS
jgi:hypothetical protein